MHNIQDGYFKHCVSVLLLCVNAAFAAYLSLCPECCTTYEYLAQSRLSPTICVTRIFAFACRSLMPPLLVDQLWLAQSTPAAIPQPCHGCQTTLQRMMTPFWEAIKPADTVAQDRSRALALILISGWLLLGCTFNTSPCKDIWAFIIT